MPLECKIFPPMMFFVGVFVTTAAILRYVSGLAVIDDVWRRSC